MAGRMKLSNAIRPLAGLTEKFCLSRSALPSRPQLASAKLLAGGNGSDPAGRAD
jgi:hypothetical protein